MSSSSSAPAPPPAPQSMESKLCEAAGVADLQTVTRIVNSGVSLDCKNEACWRITLSHRTPNRGVASRFSP